MKTAYATTLCNGDGYVPGVEALGASLAASGSKVPRVLMLTDDVSWGARERLSAQGWALHAVEPIANPNSHTQQLIPRFDNVFTKLRAWELIDFDKVVLLDADTIVLQNVDDLFDRPDFAAAPDFFWPDRFNSGVMVLAPSEDTFRRMSEALGTTSSYDGGDQGFLNTFFPDWYAMSVEHRLPAGYNLAHFIYQFMHGHGGAREKLEREVKILHYLVQKPWRSKSTLTGASEKWWEMYFEAHPEKANAFQRRLHEAEDWSFDRLVQMVVG